MIPRETIDKILDAAQILDVVSDFVTLRRRGQNYVGLCPFHNEKTPSFSVSPSRNICKCFSCGKGGTPVYFLMEHEQMTFPEAIRWLGKRYGIEIEERVMSDEEKQAQTAREGMLAANDYAQQTWESDLYNTDEGRNVGLTYFRERGFQDETIRRFHLGYALDNKTSFAERAMQAGHRREYLLSTGLCYGDDASRLPVNRFRGRVIFPFHTLSGKTVAFGGRVLLRVDHTAMKYVNSPESEIYHKSQLLYGIYEAKQDIAKRDKCYLVEGYTDVLSMSQAGFRNVVASSGTSLTSGQIRMIQRFTRNITVLYDGDAAGIRASLRGIDMLLVEGMNVKVMLLPDGDDPDSFARKHTTEELEQYFAAHETDFIRFKTQLLMQDAKGDPLKRAQMIQSIVRSIALIPDTIMSSVYLRETAQTVDMNERDLMHALSVERQQNYATELRREQRVQSESRANDGSNATSSTLATAGGGVNDATASEFGPTTASPAPATGSEPTTTPSLATIEAMPLPTTASPARTPLPTDRYEQGIVRYIVRSGGATFTLRWNDPESGEQSEEWRVIDFIGSELYQDQIDLQHPLYARMFQLALDASADPAVPFDSVRFFSTLDDAEVVHAAIDMMEDRYDALGIVKNEERLDVLVPRAVLELKDAIVRMQVASLKQQLRQSGVDVVAIMQQLNEKNEIRKALEKDLGERIITV